MSMFTIKYVRAFVLSFCVGGARYRMDQPGAIVFIDHISLTSNGEDEGLTGRARQSFGLTWLCTLCAS